MKDKELGIRQQLVWLFQRTGEAGAVHLGELLKDADVNIRMQAGQALRNLGPKAAKAIPAIKEAVKDTNSNVRLNAMLALAATGAEGPDYLAKQFPLEKDANIRANLIQNLVYSRERQYAIPLIKPAMKDSAVVVRQTMVNVLSAFGPNSKEGFEAIEIGLKDSESQVRTSAAYAGNLYGSKCWQPLETELKTVKDAGFRIAVLQTMQNSQYRSKTGVGPISDCLKDGNVQVKQMACNILGNIGAGAADALPALRELITDNNPAVQNAARSAVQRIEPKK